MRGSIPSPGFYTNRVGGNTTCVSLRHDDHILVFDAGTGIRALGQYLQSEPQRNWRGCIFLSHYHWDHIQGLPFFTPARDSNNRFHLYGERKSGVDLEQILRQQMQEPYFPVRLDEATALVEFRSISAGDAIEIYPEIVVETVALNHPQDSLGFKVRTPDGVLCIITDHEHPDDALDPKVVEFCKNADLLVHEAQYTPEQKRGEKRGWGHSSWEEAAMTARDAEVGRLFLSHHDPERTDEEVYAIRDQARKLFENTEVATESTRCEFP